MIDYQKLINDFDRANWHPNDEQIAEFLEECIVLTDAEGWAEIDRGLYEMYVEEAKSRGELPINLDEFTTIMRSVSL